MMMMVDNNNNLEGDIAIAMKLDSNYRVVLYAVFVTIQFKIAMFTLYNFTCISWLSRERLVVCSAGGLITMIHYKRRNNSE